MGNRPDITIKTRKEKTCILTDVEIPAHRRVMQNKTGQKFNVQCSVFNTIKIQMFM
jgi:hypothetical protein